MPENTSLQIKDGVVRIGEAAFAWWESLESIIIPDSVTYIGMGAFSGCISLESIIIPDSVTSIDDYAFYGCDNLTIYGYEDSYAQTYAKENSINFVVIEPIIGDVDGNGTISSIDASMLARYLTSDEEGIITEQGMSCADVNHDGELDMKDLVKLKKFLVDNTAEL